MLKTQEIPSQLKTLAMQRCKLHLTFIAAEAAYESINRASTTIV